MTEEQKKDFGELRKLFEDESRSMTVDSKPVKVQCNDLLNKYTEELKELQLLPNTKRTQIAILLIAGKFGNADIERVLDCERVGDKKFKLRKSLEEIEKYWEQ